MINETKLLKVLKRKSNSLRGGVKIQYHESDLFIADADSGLLVKYPHYNLPKIKYWLDSNEKLVNEIKDKDWRDVIPKELGEVAEKTNHLVEVSLSRRMVLCRVFIKNGKHVAFQEDYISVFEKKVTYRETVYWGHLIVLDEAENVIGLICAINEPNIIKKGVINC